MNPRIITTSNLFLFIIFTFSILCFFPLLSGYDLPKTISDFSPAVPVYVFLALTASTTVSLLIFLDYVTDITFKIPKPAYYPEEQQRTLILVVIFTNFLMLGYILPFGCFNILPGVVGMRDTIIIGFFLMFMNKMESTIWNIPAMSLAFLFGFANILSAFSFVLTDDSTLSALRWSIFGLVCVGWIGLFITYRSWYRHLKKLTDEVQMKRLAYGNLYADTFLFYIIGDWIYCVPGFNNFWSSAIGPQHLTYDSCLITLCVTFLLISISKMNKLETLEAQRDQKLKFLRYMSHELRTPLNTVSLGLKCLKRELQVIQRHESFLETIDDIQKSVDISVDKLNQMLIHDKVGSGILHLERKHMDPWPFLKRCISPFLIQAREANVTVNLPDDEAMEELLGARKVLVDRHKMGDVFGNLMSNAIKFSKNGAVSVSVEVLVKERATVSKRKPLPRLLTSLASSVSPVVDSVSESPIARHVIRIAVKDNGVGISKENQKRLFSEIIQFSPGTLQEGSDAGLGLYISKSIVELHGGQISVSSEGEGCGCTFMVVLPLYLLNEQTSQFRPSGKNVSVFNGDAEAVDHSISSEDFPFSSGRAKGSTRVGDGSPTEVTGRTARGTVVLPFRGDNHPDRVQPFHISDLPPVRHIPSQAEGGHMVRNTVMLSGDHIDRIQPMHSGQILFAPRMANRASPFESTAESNPIVRPLRLLVVDDSPLSRKMMCRVLSSSRREFIEAEHGQMAVDLVQQAADNPDQKIDVILMDYQMPILDGPAAIRRIRELHFSGFIVGVTGNVVKIDLDAMKASGADEVLTKPFDEEVFERMLGQYLRKS